MNAYKLWITTACCLALAGISACGDDDAIAPDAGHHTDASMDANTDANTDNTDAAADANDDEDSAVSTTDAGIDAATPTPLYAIAAQVLSEDNNQTFLVVTDSFDNGTALTVRGNGIEIAGRALGFGPVNGGRVFVGGDTGPSISRYDLQSDGTLQKFASEVSFLGRGIATIGEYGGQFYFVSENKAYFFDGETEQLVVWNPETMTVTGGVALTDLAVPVDSTTFALTTFTSAPLRVGNKLLMFPGWRVGPTIVPSEVGVVVVDTTDDSVNVVRTSGVDCGWVRDGALGSDGMVYMATEGFGTAAHHVNNDNAPAPCMLRFDPTTEAFDASFNVALNSLAGGRPVGSLIRGPEGSVFLRVLEPTVAAPAFPPALAGANAWQWGKLTLGDTPSLQLINVATAPLSGGRLVMSNIGEQVVIPLFDNDDGSTAFIELTEAGPGDTIASIDGLAFSFVKLR